MEIALKYPLQEESPECPLYDKSVMLKISGNLERLQLKRTSERRSSVVRSLDSRSKTWVHREEKTGTYSKTKGKDQTNLADFFPVDYAEFPLSSWLFLVRGSRRNDLITEFVGEDLSR